MSSTNIRPSTLMENRERSRYYEKLNAPKSYEQIRHVLAEMGVNVTRAGVQVIERRALAKIRAVLEKDWAAERGEVQEASK